MIVYAESNFVLELAFLQEEFTQAEQIVGLAESREVQLQDAIVFASVVSHLQSLNSGEPKLFVTRNSRDFSNQDIKDLLLTHNCELLFRFADAVGYIQSRLRDAQ